MNNPKSGPVASIDKEYLGEYDNLACHKPAACGFEKGGNSINECKNDSRDHYRTACAG